MAHVNQQVQQGAGHAGRRAGTVEMYDEVRATHSLGNVLWYMRVVRHHQRDRQQLGVQDGAKDQQAYGSGRVPAGELCFC